MSITPVSEENMAALEAAASSLDLSRRIPKLDGIRGIAIGMVILRNSSFNSDTGTST